MWLQKGIGHYPRPDQVVTTRDRILSQTGLRGLDSRTADSLHTTRSRFQGRHRYAFKLQPAYGPHIMGK